MNSNRQTQGGGAALNVKVLLRQNYMQTFVGFRQTKMAIPDGCFRPLITHLSIYILE